MIMSLMGSNAYVDLCEAIDDKILFTIAINGEPPIVGKAMGISSDLQRLVTIVVNQEYPYNVVIGLVEASTWNEQGVTDFYIELSDSVGRAGNVTVTISRSVCDRAEETDKELGMYYSIFPKLGNFTIISSSIPIKSRLTCEQI